MEPKTSVWMRRLSVGVVLFGSVVISSAEADDPPVFSLSTNSLTYAAPSPNAKTPPSQVVSATLSSPPSGTLYVIMRSTGPAVTGAGSFAFNGTTGQGRVTVAPPPNLGIGVFSSTITVTACLNDSTCATGQLPGSPQVIDVTYTIARPPIANGVMPQVVAAGKAGRVIIRGNGLADVTGVSFGATPASSFTVVSSTEIQANYPETLTAGTYAVNLLGGPENFSGSLVVAGAQPYTAQRLALPETPLRILSALYDAERSSLLVCAGFFQSGNNKLWRYTYSPSTGAWAAEPEVFGIPEIADVAFSTDGSRLIAVTGFSILELDASNPGAGALRITPGPYIQGNPAGTSMLRRIALANDGSAMLGSAIGATFIPTYMYSSADGALFELNTAFQLYTTGTGSSPTLAASADGSRFVAVQSGLTSPPFIIEYNASTGRMANTILRPNHSLDQPATLDASGSKLGVFLNGTNRIYNRSYTLLGSIPGQIRTMVLNPQGTRAYALNQTGVLRTYNLAVNVNGSSFPELGTGLPQVVPASSGSTVRLLITPDGGTLFLIGDAGIAVIPVPN
jgi:hypothetical protein